MAETIYVETHCSNCNREITRFEVVPCHFENHFIVKVRLCIFCIDEYTDKSYNRGYENGLKERGGK